MKNSNKTALITGASRGLGLALARYLAQNNWNLIINARSAADLETVKNELSQLTRVVAIPGSINDDIHRKELATKAGKTGGLDLVINNAGSLGVSPLPDLLTYPVAALRAVFETNVIAQLALLQHLRSHLSEYPVVINITSDAAVEAYPGWGGYGSSKAAFEQISAVLAAEQRHWKVYSVDPGDMRTQMHQAAFPGEDISDRPLPETVLPGFVPLFEGRLPSGRYKALNLIANIPTV